jgi:hypothetical protein
MRTMLIGALALPAASLLPAPAAACVFLAVPCLGPSFECNPSPAERLADAKRLSAEATRERLAEARDRLRSGKVDVAAELAELLVPNVRPVYLEYSDCGAMGEIDFGAGIEGEEERFRALTAGTPFAGADLDRFRTMLRREDEDLSFGAPCNAEFRRGFADRLRRSVDPAELRLAWTFLAARQRTHGTYGPIYHRLMRFEGRSRKPPLRWHLDDLWLRGQVETALRRTSWGPSLKAAIDSFWAGTAARLDDSSFVCPQATARWSGTRERVLAKMAEWEAGRFPSATRER